jgi:2'-5' RNA ligase
MVQLTEEKGSQTVAVMKNNVDSVDRTHHMPTLRAFIGIPLPPALQQQIRTAQQSWQIVAPDIRWTKVENLHLTLRFLGEITESQIDPIYHCMQQAATGISPFTLTIEGMGVFPNLSRPRVLWLGIGEEKEVFQTLYTALDTCLQSLGLPSEDRSYTPHLTLARLKSLYRKPELQRLIEQSRQYSFDSMTVHHIDLIRSQLHPKGAVYTQLRTVILAQ